MARIETRPPRRKGEAGEPAGTDAPTNRPRFPRFSAAMTASDRETKAQVLAAPVETTAQCPDDRPEVARPTSSWRALPRALVGKVLGPILLPQTTLSSVVAWASAVRARVNHMGPRRRVERERWRGGEPE